MVYIENTVFSFSNNLAYIIWMEQKYFKNKNKKENIWDEFDGFWESFTIQCEAGTEAATVGHETAIV